MKLNKITEENLVCQALYNIAQRMLLAAKTAPKGRAKDNLEMSIADNVTIELISNKMRELGEKRKIDFFIRDAENILQAPYMVLIGTKISPIGLDKCSLCGFRSCKEKEKRPKVPCAFNTGDLGIAIGSAVSVAMDARVDNRIMFSVGQAVKELNIMGDDVQIIYGIPLSATAKNPFFDRK